MPKYNLQTGGAGTMLLVPLALLGALFVGLVILGVLHWEGRTPISEPVAPADVRPATPTAGSAPHELPAGLTGDYDRSCRVCHNVPGTGAPQAGDAAAWQPRLEKGLDTLLEHTVAGFQGMPPMGMCMHCSRTDFLAFIHYMAQFQGGGDCAP